MAVRCLEKENAAQLSDAYPAAATQEITYDPWGVVITSLVLSETEIVFTESHSRYKYNGKEQYGMGWFDYGARYYDPTIGRWNAIDPMAELDFLQSPYNYVDNAPITRIDLFGMVDVGDDDEYYGSSLREIVVKAKKNRSLEGLMISAFRAMDNFLDNGNNVRSTLDIALSAINKNYDRPGYQAVHKAFQDGGRDAVVLVGGSIGAATVVTTGAAEGTMYLARLAARSTGRLLVRSSNWVLKNTNIGSAVGDIAQQLAHNNGDFSKVDLLSSGAQLLKGKLVLKSAISSFAEISLASGFEFNGVNSTTLTDFGINIFGNVATDKVAAFYNGTSKAFGKASAGMSNLYDAVANFIIGGTLTGSDPNHENEN